MDRAHEAPPRTCLKCGYTLEGLVATEPGVCPECSRAFDFRDPRSTGPKRWHRLWRLARLSPPLFFFFAFAGLLCALLVLWGSPTGDVSDGAAMGVFFGTIGFSLVWGIGFVASAVCRTIVRPRDGKLLRWMWRWWRFPLSFALAAVLQFNGYVWSVRWWQAQDGFNALRAGIIAGRPVPAPPFHVGTFRVARVDLATDASGSCLRMVFILGGPDAAYSDMAPAVVSTPASGVAGWPIVHSLGDEWFHCMDPT